MMLSAAIFDVDGVLVASPHERAWREALTGFADPAGFTTAFYQANVAGKQRLEGARSALEQLGVAECRSARPGLRRSQAGAGRPAHRRGQLRGVSRTRCASPPSCTRPGYAWRSPPPRRTPGPCCVASSCRTGARCCRSSTPTSAAATCGAASRTRALPAGRRGLGDPAGAVPGGRGRAGRLRGRARRRHGRARDRPPRRRGPAGKLPAPTSS